MLLKPYTVLDFTDERGEIGPMLMGDLGANVIRVELPAGSSSRQQAPFNADAPVDLRSLSFQAFNRNKRSITLDPDDPEDCDTLLKLLRRADFVFESWPHSSLAVYRHNFESVAALNPRVVYTRLSPFGDSGPHADLLGNDLVIAAMGGPVALQGDVDRAPVRLSVPQVWRHAGTEGAAGALVAFHRMLRSGQAQFVDLSAQCAMTWTMLNGMDAYAIQGFDFQRNGGQFNTSTVRFNIIHPAKDGHVVAIPRSDVLRQCLPWLIEHGHADAAILDIDWDEFDLNWTNPEHKPLNVYQAVDLCRLFFSHHSKQELLEFGLQHQITLAPVNTLTELLAMGHMQARDYWIPLTLPGGQTVNSPGLWAKSNVEVMHVQRPAPALGQHGDEIRSELEAPAAAKAYPAVEEAGALPFAGVTVADFAWVGVGPISAKYLADHGAKVIRIESESRPDVLRANVPFRDNQPGIDRSQFFGDFNTSKQSISLNMKKPQAIEIAKQIIAKADVMIESFAPGAIKRMGLDYGEVKQLNPGLIMISTCLMGQTGPAAQMAGYGYHAGAIAGFYEVTGWPDRAPNGPWVAYTDTIAPRFISALIAAALDHRRRTGEGCYMDVAQIETALHFLAPELLDVQLSGNAATRIGNRSTQMAPQGCYPCQGDDNWCAIAVETDQQWQALCNVMQRHDLQAQSGYATHAERLLDHDKLDAAISEWTADKSAREVMQILQQAGVPAGVAQRSSDLLQDPQYQYRHFYRYHDHSVMGHTPYAGHQYRISNYDNGPRGPAPTLGQHSFEVLSEFLNMDDAAIADAYAAGVVA